MKNDKRIRLSDDEMYVDAHGCIYSVRRKAPVANFIVAYLEYLKENDCENSETYDGLPNLMCGESLTTYCYSLLLDECKDIASFIEMKPYDICITQLQGRVFELNLNAICTKDEWSVTNCNALTDSKSFLTQRRGCFLYYDLDLAQADRTHTHAALLECYMLVSDIYSYRGFNSGATTRCGEVESIMYEKPNKRICGLVDIREILPRIFDS